MVAPWKKALLFAGHLSARLSYWQASVRCILAAGSLESLDDRSRGRLLYALMMCGAGGFATSTLDRLMRSESNKSPSIDCWLATAAQRLGNLPEAIRLYRQAASYGSYEGGSAVSRMARLLEEISSGEAAVQIGKQVDALSLAEDHEVIVVSLSGHHLPLFDEWLRQARAHAKGRVVAAGLDAAAVAELRLRLPDGVMDLSAYFEPDSSEKASRL